MTEAVMMTVAAPGGLLAFTLLPETLYGALIRLALDRDERRSGGGYDDHGTSKRSYDGDGYDRDSKRSKYGDGGGAYADY